MLIVYFVIEISVILLQITGLDKKIARFQVISMLTRTGYTSDESNLIIKHPVRRRLSAFLILFGSFSLAVIISAITNLLSGNIHFPELIIVNTILLVIFLLGKTGYLQKLLKKKFQAKVQKYLDISELPVREVLYLQQEDIVTKVTVNKEHKLINQKVNRLEEGESDFKLLFIIRGKVTIRKNMYNETIHAGDVLVLYGNKNEINSKFF